MRACVCVCVLACVRVSACVCACVRACVHACVRACVCVCVFSVLRKISFLTVHWCGNSEAPLSADFLTWKMAL